MRFINRHANDRKGGIRCLRTHEFAHGVRAKTHKRRGAVDERIACPVVAGGGMGAALLLITPDVTFLQ